MNEDNWTNLVSAVQEILKYFDQVVLGQRRMVNLAEVTGLGDQADKLAELLGPEYGEALPDISHISPGWTQEERLKVAFAHAWSIRRLSLVNIVEFKRRLLDLYPTIGIVLTETKETLEQNRANILS